MIGYLFGRFKFTLTWTRSAELAYAVAVNRIGGGGIIDISARKKV